MNGNSSALFNLFTDPVIWFVLLVTFSSKILYLFNRYRTNTLEKKEDFQEVGVNDPQPFRPLSEDERLFLEEDFKLPKWVASNSWWLLIVFSALDLLFLAFTYYARLFLGFFNVLIFFVAALFAEIRFLDKGLRAQKYYLDIITPVFRVEGEALREIDHDKYGTHYHLTIRNIRFSEENYADLCDFVDTIEDGQEVIAEYSMHTKHVWKLEPLIIKASDPS